MALARRELNPEVFDALSNAYRQMVRAVEQRELGWGLYLCRK